MSASEKPRVSKRIAAIAESATLAVDSKAKALKAAGRPVIGFGAGEPDFPTPDYIVNSAVEAAKVAANHRYTPAAGLPELRDAIVKKTKRDSNYEITSDQVLVTNGGKQAVYQAFASILDPGDEVILPSPYWTTYPECIKLAGGVSVEVFADESQNYLVSVEQLEKVRTAKTKVLLFCSPSNPTGSVYSPEQVKAIGNWALANGLWVVTDEIYEHLLYDGATAPSICVAVPALADRTIIINGVAKTYAMTGWRVGWMIGPKDVSKASIKVGKTGRCVHKRNGFAIAASSLARALAVSGESKCCSSLSEGSKVIAKLRAVAYGPTVSRHRTESEECSSEIP